MTRSRCKHENADHLMPGDVLTPTDYAPIEEGQPVLVEQFRCLDCGAWLSLGESDESKVAVEVRAAALAADWDDDDARWDGFLSLGMCSPDGEHAPLIERDIAEGRKYQRDLDDYLAGHLARVIAEHGRDP